MTDEGLLDAVRRAHGAAAFAQAAEVLAVRELYRRRRVERAGVEFAAAEASVAVQISEGVAAGLIDIGIGLDRLPRIREAFVSGRIDLARTQVLVENVRELPEELLADVEPTLIDVAERLTPARLRQTVRRWVAKLDPEGEQRRRERREGDRDVRIKAVQDGMAVFEGLLPAVGAQTVAMRLREMSSQVCRADPRTMPQRRADALVALADGSNRLRCACGRGKRCTAPESEAPQRPLIQIGVPAETLLGERDSPAHLSGYGPIDAALVRRIAEYARFQAIPERAEDPAGARESARPEPTRRQERDVRALDGVCRFPGCTMPASESLVDHGVPGDTARRGSVLADLAVLCTRHHRLKAAADRGETSWRVRRVDADRLRWKSPTGDEHITFREGERYLFPHTDIGAFDALWPSPASVPAPPHLSTVDLTYPIEHGAFVHPEAAAMLPENEPPGRLVFENRSR
ncbi:hypothetical protein NRB20_73290 [Nocardia sp. RB20]|uniref:DUF222 domain-containing protein n=2 Tax=Nocardia macrotermitis TaxID=2585198 RepID=A0A7K0DHC3_9NOCA|nr:hypothetical protein [Nocardia macrotermitis]